jgi:hypothetical protein
LGVEPARVDDGLIEALGTQEASAKADPVLLFSLVSGCGSWKPRLRVSKVFTKWQTASAGSWC